MQNQIILVKRQERTSPLDCPEYDRVWTVYRAAFMRVASTILSSWVINRLKLSMCVFFTYIGSVPPLSMIFFIFDVRVRICWRKIWKNTSSGTSPSPPRYSNWAAILSLMAISNGCRCPLKLSTLQSRSREYPRSRVNQSRLRKSVGQPTSLILTHKQWPLVVMCPSPLFFIDCRMFFSLDCWAARFRHCLQVSPSGRGDALSCRFLSDQRLLEPDAAVYLSPGAPAHRGARCSSLHHLLPPPCLRMRHRHPSRRWEEYLACLVTTRCHSRSRPCSSSGLIIGARTWARSHCPARPHKVGNYMTALHDFSRSYDCI